MHQHLLTWPEGLACMHAGPRRPSSSSTTIRATCMPTVSTANLSSSRTRSSWWTRYGVLCVTTAQCRPAAQTAPTPLAQPQLHFKTHKACSKAYDIGRYSEYLSWNSQLAEQQVRVGSCSYVVAAVFAHPLPLLSLLRRTRGLRHLRATHHTCLSQPSCSSCASSCTCEVSGEVHRCVFFAALL